jgi:hypothetical protein
VTFPPIEHAPGVVLIGPFGGLGQRRGVGPAWPRAATFLARQAPKDAVVSTWRGPVLAMRAANITTQLISLPFFLTDPDLARRVRQCSRAQ